MGSSVKKRSFRIEYFVGLLALALAIFGYYCALAFYWSGLKNSPFGYETCGLEFIAWFLCIYPAYIVSLLLKALLVWKFNYPKIWCWVSFLMMSAVSIPVKSSYLGVMAIAFMLLDFVLYIFAAISANKQK